MLVVYYKQIRQFIKSLLLNTDFNTKVAEIEAKISYASNLVKMTDFDTKFKKNQ